MGNNITQQLRVVAGGALKSGTFVQDVSFFDINGQPVAVGQKAVNVPDITTANATDLPTTQALANQNKATVNAILTALKNAGLMRSV